MNVTCPQCHASLDVPEDAEDKQIRCTACQSIIRIDRMVLEARIQRGMPGIEPNALSRSATNPLDDEEDFRRDIQQQLEITEEVAKRKTRRAASVVLWVLLFTVATVLINGIVGVINEINLEARAGRGIAARVLAGPLVGMSFFAPMLVFEFLGYRCLLGLRSRGLIVTGIVMNFILMLMFGGLVALDIYILKEVGGLFGAPMFLVVLMLVMHCTAFLLNLAAAIQTMITTIDSDVAAAYLIRAEHLRGQRLL